MNKLGTSFLTPSLYPPTTVTCWFKWAAFGSYSPLKFVCPYRVKTSTNSIAWVVLLPLSTGCLTASKPLWWIAGHHSLLNCIHHYLPLLTNPVQKKTESYTCWFKMATCSPSVDAKVAQARWYLASSISGREPRYWPSKLYLDRGRNNHKSVNKDISQGYTSDRPRLIAGSWKCESQGENVNT